MEGLYKFGTPYPEDQEWLYPNLWATEDTSDGGSRTVIAPTHQQVKLIIKLLQAMTGPFWVLYVLVIPRGGGEAGRYQSPAPQVAEDVAALLTDFTEFLEKDGRHNIWVASATTSQMLIYDRHNVIYAYGDLNIWQPILAAADLSEASTVRFPDPHSHHYHQAFDAEEQRVAGHWDWHRTPLLQSDES